MNDAAMDPDDLAGTGYSAMERFAWIMGDDAVRISENVWITQTPVPPGVELHQCSHQPKCKSRAAETGPRIIITDFEDPLNRRIQACCIYPLEKGHSRDGEITDTGEKFDLHAVAGVVTVISPPVLQQEEDPAGQGINRPWEVDIEEPISVAEFAAFASGVIKDAAGLRAATETVLRIGGADDRFDPPTLFTFATLSQFVSRDSTATYLGKLLLQDQMLQFVNCQPYDLQEEAREAIAGLTELSVDQVERDIEQASDLRLEFDI